MRKLSMYRASFIEVLETRNYLATNPFVPGRLNNAASFNTFPAVSFNMGDPADNHLDIGTNATIETWVKFDALPQDDSVFAFVSKDEGQGNKDKWIFGYANNDIAKNKVFLHITNTQGGGVWLSSNSWTPLVGQWYHVAVVKTGNVYRFYRDGVATSGALVSQIAMPDVEGSFQLGQAEYDPGAPGVPEVPGDPGDPDADPPIPPTDPIPAVDPIPPSGFIFPGSMDDVRVWNSARTLAQISTNYTKELTGTEAGLVGYWKLNEPTGETTDDATAFDTTGTLTGSNELDVPVLSSFPGAPATLYLDFDGDYVPTWGGDEPGFVEPYDSDYDPTTYSEEERANIQLIWELVSDMFAPFKINVTTVQPTTLSGGKSSKIDIGGNGDWVDDNIAGIAYVNGFTSGDAEHHIGFAFGYNVVEDENGDEFDVQVDPSNLALIIAHEAGHQYGLIHQSVYDPQGVLVQEYHSGFPERGPIMGAPYISNRKMWWNGTSDQDDSTKEIHYQDDLALLTRAGNGFGYRLDDIGNTAGAATPLQLSEGSLVGTGIIEKSTDVDVFSFNAGAGPAEISVDIGELARMLDVSIELRTAGGELIASANEGLSEALSLNLAAGSYRLIVKSNGLYGEIGRYKVTALVTPPPPPPTASIKGVLFNDTNNDGTRQNGEAVLTGQKVFLDLDGDNALDAGEANVITDGTGAYSFTSLPAGTYYVRPVVATGWQRSTLPADLTITNGQAVTGILIGLYKAPVLLGSLSGVVFGDSNKNGVYDAGDTLGASRVVFLDLDGDNAKDSNETSVLTDANGKYTFTGLVAGTYHVRRVFPSGYILSGAPIDFNLAAGQNATGINIGSKTGTPTPTPTPTPTKGTISGFLFFDTNKNGKYDSGDVLQTGKTVFIDFDGDSFLDTNETKVTTNSQGQFSFGNLNAGTFKIRRVVPNGYKLTTPARNISLTQGQIVTGVTIGTVNV